MAKQNLSGAPGVYSQIVDLSNILANVSQGIVCVQGVTSRGEPGKNYLIGTWADFKAKLGGYVDGDDFAKYCKRALQGGATLRVAPLYHYEEIDTIATAEGNKATGSIDSTAEVLATVSGSITAMGTAGDTVTLSVDLNDGNGAVQIGTYAKASGDTEAVTAAALIQNVNDNTGTHGFTGVANAANFTITAPVGSGVAANNYDASVAVTGTLTATVTQDFSGGVDAVSLTIEANVPSEGYNGTTIEVTDARSGDATKCDLKITLYDSPESQEILSVNRTLSAQDVTNLNNKLDQLTITTAAGGGLINGVYTLTGGSRTISNITDVDWAGSSIAKNGWYAFDDVDDSMRIMMFYENTPAREYDLGQYVKTRGDMVVHVPMPLNLSISEMNDYRDGTGAYSHAPLNNEYVRMVESDLDISDDVDPDIRRVMYGIADIAAIQSVKDNDYGPWYSGAGFNRGTIRNKNNGVRINLASKGNKTQYDSLYEKGVNSIVVNNKITMYWGNRTTLLDRTSLLSKENVVDLCVYISRVILSIAKKMSFDPNDPIMWNQLYRNVRPFIVDTLCANRAIQTNDSPTRGEDELWFWQGDQFAKDINSLTYNKKTEVDAGKYRARFVFISIVSNEYIGIEISSTDSTTMASIISNPEL